MGLGAGVTMGQAMMAGLKPAAPSAPAAAPADAKFCLECGQSIPRRARFCPECGKAQ